MKLHYFQRYHEKENVATANTMLLLSRLYSMSPDKFFRFLKSEFFSDSDFEPEILFNLQEKSVNSVPDATITQNGFKIVVETKMSDWFYEKQLVNHLNSFKDEKYKVLITLAPVLMDENKKNQINEKIELYNKEKDSIPVIHINTTFELLSNAIREVIDERDYEMQNILDDYIEYCYHDGLIQLDSSKYTMRMKLAGTTFNFNLKNDMYYDNAEHSFRPHNYLALYTNKSIRAVGKICAIITAVETENGMEYYAKCGELTDERKNKILSSIEDGLRYGYNLKEAEHNYFFVEKFYETDYKKITPYAPMGQKYFNLSEIIETDEMPETSKIAELLFNKTWG